MGACQPQRPRITPWNPQRHPAHRLWQIAATPGSPRVLRQQGPRTVSLTLDPGGLPPIQANSPRCPLAPVAPGRFPGLELLLSHRVLWLQQTEACSSGHQRLPTASPAPGSREKVLRELRLSSPGHQRAPAGLGESRGTSWLPFVQALREPVNVGPLAHGVVDTPVGGHRWLPS